MFISYFCSAYIVLDQSCHVLFRIFFHFPVSSNLIGDVQKCIFFISVNQYGKYVHMRDTETENIAINGRGGLVGGI